jgi:hypothetical protein
MGLAVDLSADYNGQPLTLAGKAVRVCGLLESERYGQPGPVDRRGLGGLTHTQRAPDRVERFISATSPGRFQQFFRASRFDPAAVPEVAPTALPAMHPSSRAVP